MNDFIFNDFDQLNNSRAIKLYLHFPGLMLK